MSFNATKRELGEIYTFFRLLEKEASFMAFSLASAPLFDKNNA